MGSSVDFNVKISSADGPPEGGGDHNRPPRESRHRKSATIVQDITAGKEKEKKVSLSVNCLSSGRTSKFGLATSSCDGKHFFHPVAVIPIIIRSGWQCHVRGKHKKT